MLMGGTSSNAPLPSTPTRRTEYGSIPTEIKDELPIINNDLDDAPERPKIDPCLWVFHFIEGITAISAILLFSTQIAPFLFVRAKHLNKDLGFVAIIERLYISVFCILVVITESRVPIPLVRDSQILQQYISRGFLYSFIGIICLEEAHSERVLGLLTDTAGFHILWAALFMEVSAWSMLGMGMLYMALGILCMKILRDRMAEREERIWSRYRKEVADWKRRREQVS